MTTRFFLTQFQSVWAQGGGARFSLSQQVEGRGWVNAPRLMAVVDVSWVKGGGYDCGYVRGVNGEGFGKSWALCLVTVPDVDTTSLDAIAQDAQTVDMRFGRIELDTPVSSLPQAVREAAVTVLENRRIPSDWITGSTTVREVIVFIVRLLNACQSLGVDFPEVDLTQTFSTIPALQRVRIRAWATARNIDVGDIINSTPIRAVIRRIGQWILNSNFRGIDV